MTYKDKERIRIMRDHGCSYGQIAKTLKIPKTTIASFCQTNHLVPSDDTKPNYHVCTYCGELFVAKTKRAQEFCSSNCRVAFWRKKKAENAKQTEANSAGTNSTETGSTVQVADKAAPGHSFASHKRLDFLPKESDEWYGDRSPEQEVLCNKLNM